MQNSLCTAHLLVYAKEYTANIIRLPKVKERKIECFTLAEQKKIETAALNSIKTKMFGIVLCLYTGLRVGKLIALQWKDIDLQKGLLTIAHSCQDTSSGIVFDEPKTATSRMVIPHPKQLFAKTKKHKEKR